MDVVPGKNEVRIRESRYAALAEYEKSTGVSMEESVDRALTEYLKKDGSGGLKAG